MRQSTDLDIYVEDKYTEKAKNILEKMGFVTERFSHKMQDDSYFLNNYVHVEIHRKLISNKCPWDDKCGEIIDRIKKTDNSDYEYEMSCEDFYLYMIGHMAKHMKYSGIGIRMVVDVWVYLRKY